jgi:phospholipase A1
MKFAHYLFYILCLSTTNAVANNLTSDQEAVLVCVAELSRHAKDDVPIGDLKKQCESKVQNPIEKRIVLEKNASSNPFAILPHKPNYLLPFTYFNVESDHYADNFSGANVDSLEAEFQISLKYIISEDFFIEHLDLQAAFTAKSWWQAYNTDISSAFRETNYEPELIFSYKMPWSLFGLTINHSNLSFTHQSNGQAGGLSRSWNRVIGGFTVVDEDLIWNLRAWYRIPEEEKRGSDDPTGDDNPNIEDYMGYGELGLLWQVSQTQNLSFMFRNNFKSDNKGAVKIGWSFPLSKHLRGYVQYFNGYGESLIYYNEKVSRIGIGVQLTDWL